MKAQFSEAGNRKTSLRALIRDNRESIDAAILKANPNNPSINDAEREAWIRNDEGFYLWAKAQGWRG